MVKDEFAAYFYYGSNWVHNLKVLGNSSAVWSIELHENYGFTGWHTEFKDLNQHLSTTANASGLKTAKDVKLGSQMFG